MRFLLFFSLLTLPIIQACTGNHHREAGTVQLDHGKRWVANPETTNGVAEMQAILLKYEGKTADVANRKYLRDELELTFQDIFKQCSMTGPAHDQLHNYLLPMKAMFEKIEDGNSMEAEAAIKQLKMHLDEYHTYFQ